MNHIKKYEGYAVVNKSELDIAGNWSADYQFHLKAGRKPYTKKGFTLTEVEVKSKKSLPNRGVVFLKPEDAEKLNNVGAAIEKKLELYNELFDALTYEKHTQGYEDEELKSRGRTSGVKQNEEGGGEIRTTGFKE